MSDGPRDIFDRVLLRRRRAAAAARMAEAGFLHREVTHRLRERLDDIARRFDLALAVGWEDRARPPAPRTVYADLAPERLGGAPGPCVALDEEALPFAPHSFDLVLANLTLHWVNDLPGALVQYHRVLRPDGLFLAALFAGETLAALRRALMEAEIAMRGGASPRVAPMAEIRDLGALLQRAGFAMPVVDIETIRVSYADALRLMQDLRAMGESNVLHARHRGLTSPALLQRAAALYHERHADAEGRIEAHFDVHFLTAWARAPGQPQPKRRGSATVRLADALAAARKGAR